MTRLSLRDVETPAAVLDRAKLAANCKTMIAHVHGLGARLRPHMKTLKSIEAARIAIDPTHGGIAVSTLNEAAYFIDGGVSDVSLAVCISPDKLERAAALSRRSQLSVFIDSLEAARAIAARPEPFRVWIEIDSGEHRTGLAASDDRLVAIAEVIKAGPATCLVGVATHAGQAYNCQTVAAIQAVAAEEQRATVQAAERLRTAGHRVDHVSVGSTPTTIHAQAADGVTEFRAGVYMAGDMMQVGLWTQPQAAVAFTVLATVISRNEAERRVVIDAGGLALSKDKGDGRHGYGVVLDLVGQPSFGHKVVAEVYQEHGELHDVDPAAMDALPIGARVRVIPNHVCMTAAMYDSMLVTGHDDLVEDLWRRTNGWS
jgi:D-serine deaminase-like pyridoxal phosphate-dependent protein